MNFETYTSFVWECIALVKPAFILHVLVTDFDPVPDCKTAWLHPMDKNDFAQNWSRILEKEHFVTKSKIIKDRKGKEIINKKVIKLCSIIKILMVC